MRKRKYLYLIIKVLLLLIASWLIFPKVKSYYYTQLGAETSYEFWIDHTKIPCESEPITDLERLDMLNKTIVNLKKSLSYDPRRVNTVLFLARAYCMKGDFKEAIKFYGQYSKLKPDNPLGFIEQGFAYQHIGDWDTAIQCWRNGGLTSDEFVRVSNHGNVENKEKWLERALKLEPDNQEVLATIGLFCQRHIMKTKICKNFLTISNGNLIVDPFFISGAKYWLKTSGIEGFFEFVKDCDQNIDLDCAHLIYNDPDLLPGHLYQCIRVEPENDYQFSAWIKVELSETSKWRPVYIQGNINAQPKGYWLGDQTGSSDWHFWQYDFVADDFDNNSACFYPVIFLDHGEAWFYDVKLIQITDPGD